MPVAVAVVLNGDAGPWPPGRMRAPRQWPTVGAVSLNRGSARGGMDRSPLTWFQMLRAVGLVTCGGAPATGGTMCVGRLLLTKGGACCILSKTHACKRWNTWKCHVATTHPLVRLYRKERLPKGVREL